MSGLGNEFGVRTYEMHNIEVQDIIIDEIPMENERIRRQREEKGNSSKTLSKETISLYSYLSIKRAAKKLNIGLTPLKNRSRELGIRRWLHRKLISLETLIKNVQERNKDEEGHKLREAIEILERENKLVEESPNTQLEDQTQKLRQACFKAKYNKKLKGMRKSQDSLRSNITANSTASLDAGPMEKEEKENVKEEELKSIIATCLSSSNANMEKEQLQTFILNLSTQLKKCNYKHASSSSCEHQ